MLPNTGTIKMSQVNEELNKSSNSKISLNDNDVRKLAKKDTGKISIDDLHGKSYGYVSFEGTIILETFAFGVKKRISVKEAYNLQLNDTIITSFFISYNGSNYTAYFSTSDSVKRKIKLTVNNEFVETYMNDSSASLSGTSWQANTYNLLYKYRNQTVNIQIEVI